MPRRKPAAEPAVVRLSDSRAIRALAHPARLTIIDALYGGESLTATQFAELTRLSASATSYHLRALERWGIIVRAPATADGRERPWQAAGRTLQVESAGSDAASLADVAVVRTLLDRHVDALAEFLANQRSEPAEWRETPTVSTAQLWLTNVEVAELVGKLRTELDRYRERGRPENRPPGTRKVRVSLLALPTGHAPTPPSD